MLGWFRKRKSNDEMGMQALPVEVNPTPDSRAERNNGRIERLRLAIQAESDPKRKAQLQAELDRRMRFGK